jgi:regulatory protein
MEEHLKQVYHKLRSYCAYQERTHDEVRQKLQQLFVEEDDAELIVSQLISDDFLNEERFAKSYAGGKFRIKKWGKKRIELELKRKNLSEYCIRVAMKEIDTIDYRATLHKLAEKKLSTLCLRETNRLLQKKKLVAFLIQKGYEADLAWEVATEHTK